MDLIFEEDTDDGIGADIEAYCPKCKGDTSHTVITKYEEEIRRVQCGVCGDVHSFRKPRGEVGEEELTEPIAAKKRAAAKKPAWADAAARAGEKKMALARPYSIRDTYRDGEIVSHPKFGVGFVSEITENKVEVTFQDERRLLIHNRPDLAAQMPAIAPVTDDSRRLKGKLIKGAKGAKGKAAPPPPPAKGAKGAKAAPPPPPAPKGKVAAKAAPPAKAKAAPPPKAKPAAKPVKKAAAKPAKKPAPKKPAPKKPAPKAKAKKKK